MYDIGAKIVYGSTGVCTITDITDGANVGGEAVRTYYVIEPLGGGCMIYTPVDSKVYMRPVVNKAEAEKLIESIPGIKPEAYFAKSVQQLGSHYDEVIKTHDCESLIKLLMSIHEKKRYVLERKQKFGQLDERFMKKAEELLYSEFSVALDIPKDKVEEYIHDKVEALR